MAHKYVPVDRDRLYLLPPDMGEWLEEDHLVWFVIEVVDKVDTSELHKRHPNDGVGRPAYDPDMMLALMTYSYCTKVRSAREIERLCKSDVAYRVLSADQKPDHSTIARFRVDFQEFAKKLFVDVLALAKEAGADSVGVIAIDGTKMAANASRKRNRDRKELEAIADQIFAEAEAIDAQEDELYGDKRGDELPEEFRKKETRGKAIEKALQSLEEREKKEATARQVREKDERIEVSRQREFRSLQRLRKEMRRDREMRKRNEARVAAGLKPLGRPRKQGNEIESDYVKDARSDYEENKKRRKQFELRTGSEANENPKANLSDPDSRIMHSAQGAWIQAYNAQSAVNEDGIVVGAYVCNDTNDVTQFVPMLDELENNFQKAGIENATGTVIADAGYLSEDNLSAAGPDRLIANGKAWKMKRKQTVTTPISEDAGPVERNAHLLLTAEGRQTYGKRQHMIEPVFGHSKGNKGFRQFMQRGIEAVNAEWNLIMAAHNIEKLFNRAK
jgi:transposase